KWTSDFPLFVLGLALTFSFLALVFFLYPIANQRSSLANNMWLTAADLQELQPYLTDPSLKKDLGSVVLARQVGNASRSRESGFSWRSLTQWRTILVLAPAIIIVVAFLYLFISCYPPAVFLWGDAEEEYKALVNKRRFIWSTIIASLFVGIL